MISARDILGLAAAFLLALWVAYRVMRRRMALGRATEVERRFDATLQRFHVEIDRFKLTRQAAVKVLMNHDHAIWTRVEEMALAGEASREELRLNVHRYTEEIVPFFKPLTYYGFGFILARVLLNLLYRIDFDPVEVTRLKEFSKQRPRSVIYLMNHRSNVDYVLAAFVLGERIALSFAVGEWARVWPLEYLFKSFGSYFIRRGFRDPLYHTVLRRYVQLVTKNSVTQAMFPEGGLTRDGRLRPPKIGLLDSILCSKADRSFARELIFVPVAFNYDRVLEDRALTRELRDKRPPRSRLGTMRQVGRILFGNVWKFARRKIHKNGVAAVRFGAPISFDAWHAQRGADIFALPKEERRRHVIEFCNMVQQKIAALVPATPLCIVAKVLLDRAPLSRLDVAAAVGDEIERLDRLGAPVAARDQGADWITEGALLRFQLRHIIEIDEAGVRLCEGGEAVLRYYANSIMHHYDGVIPQVEPPRQTDGSVSDAVQAIG